MVKLYKLTDGNHQTHGGTHWGEGVSHSGTGKGQLCSKGWIHAYTDPLLAVFLAPIHVSFSSLVLWEAEGDVALTDHGLKVGCKTLTTVQQIDVPSVTTEQRVKFAILCTLEVCKAPRFIDWANDWLSGKDHSARAAARAAAPTEEWAAEAARAAASAAECAAEAGTVDLVASARMAVA